MKKQLKEIPRLSRDQKKSVSTQKGRPFFTRFSQLKGRCYVCGAVTLPGAQLCKRHSHVRLQCFCGEWPARGRVLCNKHRTPPKDGARSRQDYEAAINRHGERAFNLIGWYEEYRDTVESLRSVFDQECSKLQQEKDTFSTNIPLKFIESAVDHVITAVSEIHKYTGSLMRWCACGSPTCKEVLPPGAPANQRYWRGINKKTGEHEDHLGRARTRRFKKFNKLEPKSSSK